MPSKDQPILVITSATDATATYLIERLTERGVAFVRFDTETFPTDWQLHWPLNPTEAPVLLGAKGIINCANLRSVWYRRPALPTIPTGIIEPSAREFASRELEETLGALWQELDALWVNHPRSIRYASRKPNQLKRALELGFSVPHTILSSDPEEVRLFWHAHNGKVVFKALHQDAIEVDGLNWFAYTNWLTAERLAQLELLRYSPVIFQQYIEPHLEIRVTVVDKRLFAASIDSRSFHSDVDWRRLSPDEQVWIPHTLPPSIRWLCVKMVKDYGLNFGAFDLILTTEGNYYFLELNANGQWAWIEMIAGLPISSALIDLLCRTP